MTCCEQPPENVRYPQNGATTAQLPEHLSAGNVIKNPLGPNPPTGTKEELKPANAVASKCAINRLDQRCRQEPQRSAGILNQNAAPTFSTSTLN